ncbi:ATP-binding protein involved in chromosome partitioning [Paenalcaligenes hominis]|uniref:Iron-sulfur cluster carrier protein n=1 Tax=Paenalcaligenes hominis TaxID=643674 RepID=A0ABX0WPT8_9BURK|nr:iron-sulfur cluster carrier protein ApbC [Paenalcaligenes hominis]NJB64850.1 ATP-binding protein involved in chromosome partitioning [Paenalcaligenes hominis]GGE58506.1 iron-sulfur cluster carrier protein [Paenalcaligenes hominis]
MSVKNEQILTALASVLDPNTHKKIDVSEQTCALQLEGHNLNLSLTLPYPFLDKDGVLKQRIQEAITPLGLTLTQFNVKTNVKTHAVQDSLRPLPNVRNIIAVASGKGGVGKSTTSVNLALALSQQGAKVGLLDADIYGPSAPIMLGINERPTSIDGKSMRPIEAHGIQTNSLGFLMQDDAPAIWRGPMATQALTQLITQTAWNDLDYLIVDMPPGTGDIALTMAQKIPLVGAIVVTTPQDMALADAKKGLRMFQQVNVPVLGIVENMSVHVCSNCGHAEAIFGQHGGREMAEQYNVPWLGSLPLAMTIREQTDSGNPTVAAAPESAEAQLYHDIATKVAARIAGLPGDASWQRPKVVPRPL